MELYKMTTHELKREIQKLDNRLDKTTSNYDKAQITLNELQKLEAELEYRLNKRK